MAHPFVVTLPLAGKKHVLVWAACDIEPWHSAFSMAHAFVVILPFAGKKYDCVSRVRRLVPAVHLVPDAAAVDALCQRCAAALLAAPCTDARDGSLARLWADTFWRPHRDLHRCAAHRRIFGHLP